MSGWRSAIAIDERPKVTAGGGRRDAEPFDEVGPTKLAAGLDLHHRPGPASRVRCAAAVAVCRVMTLLAPPKCGVIAVVEAA